jgi:hypothetical protein
VAVTPVLDDAYAGEGEDRQQVEQCGDHPKNSRNTTG